MIDVLVAGGGPAGLATGILAARAGLEVTVVEPREAPADKACGEGLMPGAARALQGLAGPLPGIPLHGIRYLDGRRSVAAAFPAGPGLGVRRTALHRALWDAAEDAGVRLLTGRVRDVAQDGAGVTAAGLRARYLVAADGLHSPLRRRLGLEVSHVRPSRWGLRRHYLCRPWSDLVEVHWAPGAELYVTPVAADLVGIAVLTGTRGGFDEQLRAFPAVRERLGGASTATSVRGAGPLRQRVRSRVAGRVLLVGDAAGYVDALTGEGLAVATASAEELVRCLVAGRPGAYEAAWRRVSRRSRWLTEALLLAAGRPTVRRAVVPAAVALPRVFAAAVGQLSR